MTPLRIRIALALFLIVPVAGCGSGLNEVTGKVTLDGRAVPKLEIRFEPKDPSTGTTAIAYTQPDGTYRLHYPGDKTGAPAGEYKVTIAGGDNEGGKPVRVAQKYNSKTELTATIKSGPNVINFDVTSEPGGGGKAAKNPDGD